MQSDRLDGRNSGKIRVDAWCDLICSPTVRSCLAGPKGGDVLHGPVNLAVTFFFFFWRVYDKIQSWAKFKVDYTRGWKSQQLGEEENWNLGHWSCEKHTSAHASPPNTHTPTHMNVQKRVRTMERESNELEGNPINVFLWWTCWKEKLPPVTCLCQC